ncbi:MAG: TetR/AcrR family transcriptional regulator [Saccharopolyspora sp.]|uniref:TetR/AcrR family transcriptional regulator n=1 Tax=Saccharopolyspora sp. TaxID=33915 RepID=UPI0025F24643|nr:TetR/AcrR family transcriptional regulator [Saccharopolyspora sp.]MBQ6643135.1 TetR/AcrR family transcriptional regulator [Saccharopolyspora sp.]
MCFQRARSEQQRNERRRQILATAAAMLTEMPVAKISLNELSRRVGLAKSNVLRYFESREDVLLELLDAEMQDWIAELERSLEPAEGAQRQREDRLAAVLTESLARRPVLCDLNSAHAAVLEHNVSTDVALRHKRETKRALEEQARLIRGYLPELGAHDATRLVAMIALLAASAWPLCRPSEAMLAAYAADPALAELRMNFTDMLRRSLAVTISGLLARAEDAPLGTGPIDPT